LAAPSEAASPTKGAQWASPGRDSDRVAVWRAWAGDDRALARHFLEAGVLAPVARGEALISDEEWRAFTAVIQVGDLVVLELPGGRAAIGEVRSAAVDRPRARDRRLHQVREVAWLAELAQGELPDDVRARLSAPAVVAPIRVSAAARRLRRLVDEHAR